MQARNLIRKAGTASAWLASTLAAGFVLVLIGVWLDKLGAAQFATQWTHWSTSHYAHLLLWRMALYTALLYGWLLLFNRHRRPEVIPQLTRISAGLVLLIAVIEWAVYSNNFL